MTQKKAVRQLVLVLGILAGLGIAFVVLLAGVGMMLWFSIAGGMGPPDGGLPVGESAPAIAAEGWVNGDPPAAENISDRVVVVEAWASW